MNNQSPGFSDDPHDPPKENLREIAKSLDVEYLFAASFPRRFPAIGNILGGNHRRSHQEAPAVNIVFLVNTGSPVSYLSKRAMKALIGHGGNVPQMLYVQVHNERAIEFHLSPPGSHFQDVNVLGMDFLIKNRLSLVMDYDAETFTLQ
ncbi:hypothetical protein MIR68_004193 [Amoeboaphelidium protococcarum]|nr:hypothetical protein MIR68_004193 [Amoeboaphelidium protococcarum]